MSDYTIEDFEQDVHGLRCYDDPDVHPEAAILGERCDRIEAAYRAKCDRLEAAEREMERKTKRLEAMDEWATKIEARFEAAKLVLRDAILAEPEWWEFMQSAYADSTDPMTEDAKALAEAVRIVREALKKETP